MIYKDRITIAVAVALVGCATPVLSQQPAPPDDNDKNYVVGYALDEKARDLYSDPARAIEAARLHKDAAYRRGLNHPASVASLMMAGRMFFYADRPLDARHAFETAGRHALMIGDTASAAKAFLDAAWVADKQGQAKLTAQFARKALEFARCEKLAHETRARILNGVRISPALADSHN